MDADLLVTTCPAHLRPEAIRKLYDDLPADQREGFISAINKLDVRDGDVWDGLVAAVPSGKGGGKSEVLGAAWVQPTPGNTATVWPPRSNLPFAARLLRSAAEACDRRHIALAQLLVAEDDGYPPAMLEAAGFAKISDLIYLFAPTSGTTNAALNGADASSDAVTFIPFAGERADRLKTLVEQTYEGTHDCPALDGVRDIDDVLAGYRAQGRYSPKHWYLAQSSEVDAGVLILADHPDTGNWELVYMGVAPAARGVGVGRTIIEFALAEAARGGAERLVLAVDAANQPALRIYQAAGFVEWGRRSAYGRLWRS